MDTAFRTPLVDCFRRGEVARDVKELAARGTLAPRAHEQLALLMLLAGDADAEIGAIAEDTIRRLPAEALGNFLARPDVPADVRDFFAARGFAPVMPAADTMDAPLIEEPEAAGEETPEEAARVGTAQRLSVMTVAQRMKVAMQGTREERSILIRDPNRMVAAAVLSSPKLTESEVEAIARMGSVSDEVLRVVGTTRTWIKNYNVVAALTRNAKTPIAVTLGLLNRLMERDIKMLSSDRNIPEAIRLAARKMHVKGQDRRK